MAPCILMLGTVNHAKDEFAQLCKDYEVQQVTSGTRLAFLKDCDSGKFDNVVAISRTFHSVEITGRFDSELVTRLPKSVRFISHNGAGYDQVDVQACTERGISVSNSPSVVDAATANTAIFLILGALRRAWVPQHSARSGDWTKGTVFGRDPDGLTLGILGMGGIGTATAKRAAPFGFKLQYHNRNPVEGLDKVFGAQEAPKYVGFEEILKTSDVLSVHLPLGPATKHAIGKAQLDMMKDGAIIVNTARGAIIDEAALVDSLDSGKIWAVGLDVFEREPEIPAGLINHPGSILLPHIGTLTVDTQKAMEVLTINNVRGAVTEGKLITQVPEQRPPKANN